MRRIKKNCSLTSNSIVAVALICSASACFAFDFKRSQGEAYSSIYTSKSGNRIVIDTNGSKMTALELSGRGNLISSRLKMNGTEMEFGSKDGYNPSLRYTTTRRGETLSFLFRLNGSRRSFDLVAINRLSSDTVYFSDGVEEFPTSSQPELLCGDSTSRLRAVGREAEERLAQASLSDSIGPTCTNQRELLERSLRELRASASFGRQDFISCVEQTGGFDRYAAEAIAQITNANSMLKLSCSTNDKSEYQPYRNEIVLGNDFATARSPSERNELLFHELLHAAGLSSFVLEPVVRSLTKCCTPNADSETNCALSRQVLSQIDFNSLDSRPVTLNLIDALVTSVKPNEVKLRVVAELNRINSSESESSKIAQIQALCLRELQTVCEVTRAGSTSGLVGLTAGSENSAVPAAPAVLTAASSASIPIAAPRVSFSPGRTDDLAAVKPVLDAHRSLMPAIARNLESQADSVRAALSSTAYASTSDSVGRVRTSPSRTIKSVESTVESVDTKRTVLRVGDYHISMSLPVSSAGVIGAAVTTITPVDSSATFRQASKNAASDALVAQRARANELKSRGIASAQSPTNSGTNAESGSLAAGTPARGAVAQSRSGLSGVRQAVSLDEAQIRSTLLDPRRDPAALLPTVAQQLQDLRIQVIYKNTIYGADDQNKIKTMFLDQMRNGAR